MERGHLARFCFCGRDARAPGLAGGTPALRVLRARRSRCVICTSEKARQRASGRGGAPRLPGMNAGPKTACGGKRPLTGVVAVPVLRPSPLWSAGILPAFVFLRAGRPRSGPGGRDARAPCFVPARRPVGGRLRTTSCRGSFPLDPRPLLAPVVDLRNLVRRFRPGRRLAAGDRFITGLGMRTKTALEPIPKVHLPPGTEQGKGKRASGSASKTRHDFSRPHPRPLSRKRERGGCRIGS